MVGPAGQFDRNPLRLPARPEVAYSDPEIEVFRSHVINLEGGRLSTSGRYRTTAQDLDGLIARLDQWARRSRPAIHVVFFSHGGLVSEREGLETALRDYQWWLGNGVYPLFFVWETGFLEILAQEYHRHAYDVQPEFITDPAIEATLGSTVGRPAWNRIKASALLAAASATAAGSGQPGGAAQFAAKFAKWQKEFQSETDAPVQLHAVGHSAGAVFHCHFLPALVQAYASADAAAGKTGDILIKTLSFLAPAARIDLFKARLLPLLGQTIGDMVLFGMKRREELRDNVLRMYRKSLLYFVRNACEDPPYSTPILGLEESLRADPQLMAFFGGKHGHGVAQAIWSPTASSSGRNASLARTHGDFDDDAATMNAVMRRILDRDDADFLPFPFPFFGYHSRFSD